MTKDRIHAGHRARMRAKFERNSVDSFETYELLEMLLYHIIPHKNTHPVSKNLLFRFKSLDGVLSASREELMEVEGVGGAVADFLLAVREFVSYAHDSAERIILDDYYSAGALLRNHLIAGQEKRGVAIALMDNDMRLIGIKTIYDADLESAAVRSKGFLDCAIEHGASVVMTAHIHPYGPLYPTYGDLVTNAMIRDALNAAGIQLVEHFVVTNEGFVGIMVDLGAAFKQTAAIKRFLASKGEVGNDGIALL